MPIATSRQSSAVLHLSYIIYRFHYASPNPTFLWGVKPHGCAGGSAPKGLGRRPSIMHAIITAISWGQWHIECCFKVCSIPLLPLCIWQPAEFSGTGFECIIEDLNLIPGDDQRWVGELGQRPPIKHNLPFCSDFLIKVFIVHARYICMCCFTWEELALEMEHFVGLKDSPRHDRMRVGVSDLGFKVLAT